MDLLDLLADIERPAGAAEVVHALLPSMWFACGGTMARRCRCGCAPFYRPGRWVLRRRSIEGVTCAECIEALS